MHAFDVLEPPFSPNPLLENHNSSSVTLNWSPPFLWRGELIDYYIVSVLNESGNCVEQRVNTTFSDVIVSFTSTSENANILSCEKLTFTIEAVRRPLTEATSGPKPNLTVYTVFGGYLPS